MSRQTIAQLPADLTDQVALKRLLLEILDRLDVVTGAKGDSKYLTSNDLVSSNKNIQQIAKSVEDTEETIKSAKETVTDTTERVEDAEELLDVLSTLLEAQSLNALYFDFNGAAWQSFVGRGFLKATESQLSNAPFITAALEPEPEPEYTVLVQSTKYADGMLQTIIVSKNKETPAKYTRLFVNGPWVNV